MSSGASNEPGHPLGLRDAFERELVMVDFKPVKESKMGELSAHWDIVIGVTPDERRR